MLRFLSIRDVVLIDRLDLSFHPGLCVLTGETGAGKSILLDAFGLALGARGDTGLIRAGADRAAVSAAFEPDGDHPARTLLAEYGLAAPEADDALVLRRVLGRDGRSRAFVNDQPVSVGLLRRLGDTLVEIEGQFAEQGLLDPASHRAVLDSFAGLGGRAAQTRETWRAWREAAAARTRSEAELERLRGEEEGLRHAADEIAALDPRGGEEAELAETRSVMMHREQLVEALGAALAELSGGAGQDGPSGRGVEPSLRAARRHLAQVADKAPGRLDEALAALDRAAIEVGEAEGRLQALGETLDHDAARLEQVEERLFALRAVARKHGVEVDALPDLRERLAAQLDALDGRGGDHARLVEREAAARAAYVEAAEGLGRARREAAAALDQAVAAELPPLRLDKAVFATQLTALEEKDWSEHGMERVVFQVATNPGSAPGPMHRIASGGELARFLLALKAVVARTGPAPTLVFDEVDRGIGGAAAAAVGERLARLGGAMQVLVVTHSPQVAARGAHHWRIAKTGEAGAVITEVEELVPADRREEIARMLSGARITEEARAAADSLLRGDRLAAQTA